MDLRQLEMFRTVAEMSSFTKAGEKLHVSHSAISRQVKLLEDELQVALFARANKRVFLTEPGKALLSHSTAIFDEVTSAVRLVSQMSTKITDHLTLGTGTTMLNFFLPPVFEQFKIQYPSVAVHIKTGQWPVIIEDIRTGTVDLVIGSLPLPILGRELAVRPLYREELVVVAGKNHPLSKKKEIQPQELNDYPLLAFLSYSATRQILEHAFQELKISPKVKVELENDDAMVYCVSKGMGVGFLPRRRAMQEKLHYVRLAGTPIYRTVGLVSLRLRQPPEHLVHFCKLCCEHAKHTTASD
jgi:LysR family transcriptional activator of glutamate synthase operon